MTEDDESAVRETQLELAQTRTSLALDRTLLAWVRTALTLIGFGFTLARFVHDLIAKGYLHGVNVDYPRQLGFCMMGLGVVSLLAGAYDYQTSARKLGTAIKMPLWSASFVISLLLALVGVSLMCNLLSSLD
jgi:putative membrane protein